MLNTSAYWNNFDLNTLPGVHVITYNVTDMPSRTLNTAKLARSNKSLLTSAEYTEKTVTVSGLIGGANAVEQQDSFDSLKAHLQEAEGILRVKQGSKTVEYTGTLNGITKTSRDQNLEFELQFKCADPIGRDYTTISLFTTQTITTATLTLPFTVDGTFTAQPRFTLTIGAVTGTMPKTVQILNAETGKGIKITRTWTAGDIITITSDTLEVTANSVLIDFKGQFPKFLPGSRSLQYIDDFTTRSITLAATYQRRYA